MRQVSGNFNGTGSALYLCLGGKPSSIIIKNIESSDGEYIEWSEKNRCLSQEEGQLYLPGSAVADLVQGEGVSIFDGLSAPLSALSTVYLVADPDKNKRSSGTGNTITRWRLDTPGSNTGHFDAAINSSYVGVGSPVIVNEENGNVARIAFITVSDGTGTADDSIELSRKVSTGTVELLEGMYDFIGGASGVNVPEGIKLSSESAAGLNVSGEMCQFIATFED